MRKGFKFFHDVVACIVRVSCCWCFCLQLISARIFFALGSIVKNKCEEKMGKSSQSHHNLRDQLLIRQFFLGRLKVKLKIELELIQSSRVIKFIT